MIITNEDFSFISEMLRKETAIVLDESKKYLAESRLKQLVISENLTDVETLIQSIKLANTAKTLILKKKVIDSLTTNETYFFRDPAAFELLSSPVLKSIASKNGALKKIKIWSAACSTGQEAYSILIHLLEFHPEFVDWDVTMPGTDISDQVLEKAKNGIYLENEVRRGLPPELVNAYFELNDKSYQLKKELRSKAEFRQFNLAGPWDRLPAFDIIFLRNVMIYFDRNVKIKMLEDCAKRLTPDGFLFLGSTETTLGLTDKFEKVAAQGGCFKKSGK